jgi:titin
LKVYFHKLSLSKAQGDVIAQSQISTNLLHLDALEHRRSEAKGRRLDFEDELVADQDTAPNFITKPRNCLNLREGQRAHFEAKLEPLTDPNLQVEWLKDGKPVIVGHRFRPIHDFGYVALDILDVIPEDTGLYTARATNLVGVAEVQAQLSCQGKVIWQISEVQSTQNASYIPGAAQVVTESRSEMSQFQYLEQKQQVKQVFNQGSKFRVFGHLNPVKS